MALLGSNYCLILKPLPAIISSPSSNRSINLDSLTIDTSETDPLYRLETKVIVPVGDIATNYLNVFACL